MNGCGGFTRKSFAFFNLNPKFSAYEASYRGFSLEELGAGRELPYTES